MKNILIIVLIAAGIYFGLYENQNKTINFNNEKYKISRAEGKDGFYKFHYTTSGRDTGSNSYIEVLKFDKSSIKPEKIKGITEFIKNEYKTKPVTGASGEFGKFGSNSSNYAYTINSETEESYWFINYISKSSAISSSEAKMKSLMYINNLNDLVSELNH